MKINYKKIQNYIDRAAKIFDKYPREYFAFLFFLVFGLFLIYKVFYYTIIEYDFYRNLADRQQKSETSIPVTRGNIYSNNEK
jgi:cell division protein FtsI/penicillin-binding protein 2